MIRHGAPLVLEFSFSMSTVGDGSFFSRASQPPRTLRRDFSSLKVVLATLVAAAAQSWATAAVLDQSFTGANSARLVINDSAASVAQTFTAGVSGTLTWVNIDIYSYWEPSYVPLHVTIHGVTDGSPNNTILGERILTGVSGISLDQPIGFAQTIPVTAGLQYAIVVDYWAEYPSGRALGAWQGSSVDGYAGGMAFELPWSGQGWTPVPSVDAHFRTYVQPVPEPSALGFGVAAGIGSLLFRPASRRLSKMLNLSV